MINYVVGDLFENLPEDKIVVVPHIVNSSGGWGAGFVVPLGLRYPASRERYLEFIAEHKLLEKRCLGKTDFVVVEENQDRTIIVANMVGQKGVVSANNRKPIKYAALVKCMCEVAKHIRMMGWDDLSIDVKKDVEIHAPKFGSGLACGNWALIEELIEEIWEDFNVTIYSLEE